MFTLAQILNPAIVLPAILSAQRRRRQELLRRRAAGEPLRLTPDEFIAAQAARMFQNPQPGDTRP